MSVPFESLEDTLLRGGIAPRHVRRYLRELEEHLSDIATAQAAAGHDAQAAADRARAALGRDEDLAAAMLIQRDFRSLSARFPWLAFGMLPVLVLSLMVPLYMLVLVVLEMLNAPALISPLAGVMLFAGNFILVPAVALLFVVMARRQRHSLAWPILSTVIILFLSPHWDSRPVADFTPGFSTIQLLYRGSHETFGGGITPLLTSAWWQLAAVQWAKLSAQYALLLLPLVVLASRHRTLRAKS